MPELLPLGAVCKILDQVDLTTTTPCTLKFIEQDDEMPGLFWYYFVANDENLNANYDPRFGNYWAIREHTNQYIMCMEG